MNAQKILFFILLVVFSTNTVFSQEEEGDEYVLTEDSLTTKDKMSYSFEAGAIFSGNTFSTFYQPSINYQVNNKFTLSSGLLYINNNGNNWGGVDGIYRPFTGNLAQTSAYVQGLYQVNEKLQVGGSLYYDFTDYGSLNNFNGENLSINSRIGYAANFKYRVNKKFTIEGEIRMTNGNNPFNSPFNNFNNRFSSPFRAW